MNDADLMQLGTLLYRHSWRDSHDWARALDQLAHLDDSEVGIVAGAARTKADAAGVPSPAADAAGEAGICRRKPATC